MLDSLMLTMLTRQQIAADSSVQLKKNVSFCSILFCTVGRDCTEQMSGLVQDFRSFRGLQWHHQCLPEVAGRRPWKFESRHVQCFRLIYQMSQSAFTLHYVSIESCFGFGGTHTHTHTHPATETGQELETTGKGDGERGRERQQEDTQASQPPASTPSPSTLGIHPAPSRPDPTLTHRHTHTHSHTLTLWPGGGGWVSP